MHVRRGFCRRWGIAACGNSFLKQQRNSFVPSQQSVTSCLQVVDARMYQVVACLSHPNFRTASSFSRACLSPSAAYAAAASADGNVYVWDINGGSGASSTAAAAAGAGKGVGSSPSPAVATVLQTHGVAASGCDWCLNMPSTLASCDSKGGLRVWG